mgnify:CR=1 FL=1
MVNSEEFAKRLQMVFEYYGLSATTFSEKIDVGKATISHLLSGRNKPSLDFVLKTVKAFPEVELYWLLNGKGSFPTSLHVDQEKTIQQDEHESKNEKQLNLDIHSASDASAPEHQNDNPSNRKLIKVILCYDDGSFENFTTH